MTKRTVKVEITREATRQVVEYIDNPEVAKVLAESVAICNIPACPEHARWRGLCEAHYAEMDEGRTESS